MVEGGQGGGAVMVRVFRAQEKKEQLKESRVLESRKSFAVPTIAAVCGAVLAAAAAAAAVAAAAAASTNIIR